MVAPKSHKPGSSRHFLRRGLCVLIGVVFSLVWSMSTWSSSFSSSGSSLELFDVATFGTTVTGGNTTATTTATATATAPWDASRTVAVATVAASLRIIKEEDHSPEVQFSVATQTTLNTSSLPSFHMDYFTSKPECTALRPEEVSFTLTTQLSLERLWIMKHQCQRWPSPLPISIAIYIPFSSTSSTGTDTHTQTQTPSGSLSPSNKESLLDRLHTELRCDLTRLHIALFYGGTTASGGDSPYPVNALRNIALEQIPSSHAAYIDSDFLISKGLHNDLLTTTTELANNSKAAVVMPAFDYISECTRTTTNNNDKQQKQKDIVSCLESEWSKVPETQADILPLLSRKEPPRVERGFESINGKNRFHGTTMYKTWAKQNQTAPIEIPCIKTATYEPYLAVRVCRDLPRFPELFTGWGFNKITWIKILLKKLGYKLWQLPHGFVMHLPHEYSKARRSADSETRPPIFDQYLQWLKEFPVHPNHLPHCVDWKKEHGPLQMP